MKRSQVQVPWESGLHLRPAARLVRLAQSFHSSISFRCNGKLADARSIISVLLLAAAVGSVVDIEVSGDDEATATTAIERAFQGEDDGGGEGPGEYREGTA